MAPVRSRHSPDGSPHLPSPLCALAALRARGAVARSAQAVEHPPGPDRRRWPCMAVRGTASAPRLGRWPHTPQLTRDTTRGHRLGETSPVNTRRRRHRQSGAERTRKAVGTHMRRRRPPLKIHALRPRTLPCAPPYLVPCALISGCTSRHSHHHTAAPPSVNASSAKHPLGNLPRTLPEAAAKGGGIAARGIAARGIAARNSRPRYGRPRRADPKPPRV